ncbi:MULTISPECIES: hypothetical protein [unclassified Rhodococcus (in: high G+C Gram-positive bacteria)]|uniref:hypothetical protein n=1 Tax=unclassified Rhodococcus (in: high G+C Gram-positive bacteria) TaxID=192944 RepID=UPI000B9A8E8E|nr:MULTISPECIES: hypothetical protein [unclassified Rhodococcus (in: high G+C Gram-positive bacteria)]OZE35593.1 hypothetical protein CH259_16320 [Rhodococcus sp. 05-2254-4]OZE48022.1 hypothetical protein CH261_08915 [Rhodococcus sp. 05-2254-3]OZE49233.1 hypothetical protein CH283_16700 [Rhodococcus sp. 05-2254-2]
MQPLVVRRAGSFEKVAFALSTWIGILAVATPFEISSALDTAWPTGSNFYFAIMGVGGLGGLIATWNSSRSRTPEQIRQETSAEITSLAIIGVLWFGYGIAAFALGTRAMTAGSVGVAVTAASGLRIWNIVQDRRRMTRALMIPRPADPPALAEGEGDR